MFRRKIPFENQLLETSWSRAIGFMPPFSTLGSTVERIGMGFAGINQASGQMFFWGEFFLS